MANKNIKPLKLGPVSGWIDERLPVFFLHL